MTLAFAPLADRFGVEVSGVGLSHIDNARYWEIRALFEEHSALLFGAQDLDIAAQKRLARKFGLMQDRLADEQKQEEAFTALLVSNKSIDDDVIGEIGIHTLNLEANLLWHIVSTFLPVPALANILIAHVMTETDGKTQLASSRLVWADMPENLKEQILNQALWHRCSHSRAKISPD